jgi:hypothetical protein
MIDEPLPSPAPPTSAGQTAATKLAAPEMECERNWPEDFGHENGQYVCGCLLCGLAFVGHKRRVCCKTCAEKSRHAILSEAARFLDAPHEYDQFHSVATQAEMAAEIREAAAALPALSARVREAREEIAELHADRKRSTQVQQRRWERMRDALNDGRKRGMDLTIDALIERLRTAESSRDEARRMFEAAEHQRAVLESRLSSLREQIKSLEPYWPKIDHDESTGDYIPCMEPSQVGEWLSRAAVLRLVSETESPT